MALDWIIALSVAAVTSHPIPADIATPMSVRAANIATQPRRPRRHTVIQRGELELVPATQDPITGSEASVWVADGKRHIRANAIPAHRTGRFPNAGNPNSIQSQTLAFSLPENPALADEPIYFALGMFGVALNGVPFEPQAAEWFEGVRGSVWQYDPLGAAITLGLDANFAHVQRRGLYHYHGKPTGLMRRDETGAFHIGWAMDGFPIFVDPSDSLVSGWRLKAGERPVSGGAPGGYFDGTFLADYEFIGGDGLGECNDTTLPHPETGAPTVAYVITASYPYVPRCFIGTPIEGAMVMDTDGRRIRRRN